MRLTAGSTWTMACGLLLAAACSSSDADNAPGVGDSGINGGFGTGASGNVPATCNHNGVVDTGEQCDGNAIGGATCGSMTMGAQPQGVVRCTNTCTLDRSGCTGNNGAGGGIGAGGATTGAGGLVGTAGSGGTANEAGGTTSGGTANGGGGTPPTSGGAVGSGGSPPSDGETGRMVGMTAATNDIRHAVSKPTPTTPLPDMKWSPDIAAVAQAYANTLAAQGCNIVHSHAPGYGENLAQFGNQMATAQQVVNLWASEGACYTYGPITASDSCPCVSASGGACGHYTQLVWRGTTEVGCGVATCPGKEVWVCNYKPPGNYIGQNPY